MLFSFYKNDLHLHRFLETQFLEQYATIIFG